MDQEPVTDQVMWQKILSRKGETRARAWPGEEIVYTNTQQILPRLLVRPIQILLAGTWTSHVDRDVAAILRPIFLQTSYALHHMPLHVLHILNALILDVAWHRKPLPSRHVS